MDEPKSEGLRVRLNHGTFPIEELPAQLAVQEGHLAVERAANPPFSIPQNVEKSPTQQARLL
jgi:hypothetical protein